MRARLMCRTVVVAAVALGSVVMTGAPAPVVAAGEPLSGTVTDTAGFPLPGVQVQLIGAGGTSAITDIDGQYALTPPDGTYQLTFSKAGYRGEVYDELVAPAFGGPPAGLPVVVVAASPQVIDESLKRLPRLSGQVVDGQGAPVAASVSGSQVPFGSAGNTVAAGDGSFTVELPQEGTFRLSAFAMGFLTTYAPSTLDQNAATGWAAAYDTVTPVGQLTLLRGGTISGTVTSAGAPIAGATVMANANPPLPYPASAMAITLADGSYTLTVPQGGYQVNFSAAGYLGEVYDNFPVNGVNRTSVAVTEGQATTAINADLAAGATVTGTVRDHLGAPLQGAGVQAWLQGQSGFSPAGSAITDVNGAYTLSGLAPGPYLVTAGKSGWSQVFATGSAAPTAADVQTLAAGSTTTTNFSLLLPGALSARLLDDAGQPIVGGSVQAVWASSPGISWFPMFYNQLQATGTTDANGEFTFNGLAPTGFRVSGSANVQNGPLAYEYYHDAYTEAGATPVAVVSSAATGPVVIQLNVGATVSGRATDANGAPLAGAWVTLMGPAGQYGGAVAADANGDYSIHGVTPGTYTAATGSPLTYHPGTTNQADAVYVTVGLGDVVTGIDVQLPAPVRMEATILDATGAPIPVSGGPSFWGIAVCNAPATPVPTFSVCTSGSGSALTGSHPAAGQSIITDFPAGVFNITAYTALPIAMSATVALTVVPGDLAVCTFRIGGAGSCSVTHASPETDSDGVPAAVENGAPGGDGNSDGVADSQQTNVTSLPSPVVGGGYVTVAVPTGVSLSSVTVVDPATVAAVPPPGATVESGVVAYTLGGVAPGSTVDVDVFLTTPTAATGYAKVQGNQWVPLPGTAFTKVSSTHFILHLTDGGAGDEDGQANGTIVDPGAPISLDTTGPTITCPVAAVVVLHATTATVTAQVSDAGAGVASPTVSASVSASALGQRTVVLSATDLAGNTSTVPCGYTVGVRLIGLTVDGTAQAPVELDAGSTVKVEWRTVDANGLAVATPTALSLRTVAATCGANPTATGPATDADLNGSGIKYKGDGWWEAKWRTDRTWRDCRQLTVTVVGASATAVARFLRH